MSSKKTRPPRRRKNLLVGDKQRWVAGCTAFLGILFLVALAILVVSWFFGRA